MSKENDKNMSLKDIVKKVDTAAANVMVMALDVGIKTGITATVSLAFFASAGAAEMLDVMQMTQDQFMEKAAEIIAYIDSVDAATKGMSLVDRSIYKINDLFTNDNIPYVAPKLKATGETILYSSPVLASVTVAINKLHDVVANSFEKTAPHRWRM